MFVNFEFDVDFVKTSAALLRAYSNLRKIEFESRRRSFGTVKSVTCSYHVPQRSSQDFQVSEPSHPIRLEDCDEFEL